MAQEKEYFAFISYQRKDEEWAERLRNKLEHYRLPLSVRKQDASLPKEIRPIFRDTLELAGGILAKEIETALQQSKYLIVICSPNSAKSPWVNKEIQTFIDLGREDRIIPFIIDGIPFSDNPDAECFPPALRSLKGEKELLGISINELSRDAAAIKVVARMFGLKFDTLWQRYEREKRKRRVWIAITTIIAFLCILGIAFWMYWQNQQTQKANWKMMESQSRFVADEALKLADEGDSYLAQMLLTNILPEIVNEPNRPYTLEAEKALREIHANGNNALLRGHTKEIKSVTFSPDGRYIMSLSADSTIRIWDVETGKCIRKLKEHTNYFDNAVFSPNGKRIASASSDFIVRLWNVANSKQSIQSLKGHTGTVCSVSFSPNGKLIASASTDNTIRIWNAENGVCLNTLEGHTGDVYSVAFSPDSKIIVSASSDNTIRIWNVENGVCINTLKGHANFVFSVAFSPDGKHIVSTSRDKTIRIWDKKAGKCIKIVTGHTDDVVSAAYSSDGKQIYSVSTDKTIRIWESETYNQISQQEGCFPVAFSPNGKRIASALPDGTIRLWNNEHIKAIKCMWNVEQEKDIKWLKGHTGIVHHAAFSSDCKQVVSVSGSRDSVYYCNMPYPTKPSCFTFLPWWWDIRIWNTETGDSIKTLEMHYDFRDIYQSPGIRSVSFSPDNKQIVLISNMYAPTIFIRDTQTGENIKIFNNNRSFKYSFLKHTPKFANYSPDGKSIISSSSEIAYIWNSRTGKRIKTIKTGIVSTAVFSPDGKQIVTSSDKFVRIWNTETGKCIITLKGQIDHCSSVAFSHDGKLIVTALGKDICIWDVKTGECIGTFKENTNEIKSAAFSADDRQIVSISSDGTIRVWDFPPLQKLIDDTRERFKTRQLTPEERQKYYLE